MLSERRNELIDDRGNGGAARALPRLVNDRLELGGSCINEDVEHFGLVLEVGVERAVADPGDRDDVLNSCPGVSPLGQHRPRGHRQPRACPLSTRGTRARLIHCHQVTTTLFRPAKSYPTALQTHTNGSSTAPHSPVNHPRNGPVDLSRQASASVPFLVACNHLCDPIIHPTRATFR